MPDDKRLIREFAFPAEDRASDARWLAGLIQAVRAQITEAGHSDVRAILDEAHGAAEAVAEKADRVRLN